MHMNEAGPILSVVVVTYNSGKYLRDNLNSILAQTIDPSRLEVIITDDGSEDQTLAIANEYRSKYSFIHVLVHDRDDGVTNVWERINQNIIRGLRAVRGRYFRIIAGDDYYYDHDAFERQLKALEDDTRGQYTADAGRFMYSWPDGHFRYIAPVSARNGVVDPVRYCMDSQSFLHIPTCLIRRKVLDRYLSETVSFDDAQMMFLLLLGRIHYSDKVTAEVYRQHFTSVMHEFSNALFMNKMMDMLYLEALQPVYGEKWPYAWYRYRGSMEYAYNLRHLCRECFDDTFPSLARKYGAGLALAIYEGDEEKSNSLYGEYCKRTEKLSDEQQD